MIWIAVSSPGAPSKGVLRSRELPHTPRPLAGRGLRRPSHRVSALLPAAILPGLRRVEAWKNLGFKMVSLWGWCMKPQGLQCCL